MKSLQSKVVATCLGIAAILGFAQAQTPTQVKDLLAVTSNSYYVNYIRIGTKIFYEVNGGELWVTDGTTSGTIQLKNFASDELSTFHELGGKLMFFADSDNNGTSELWKSDGTVSGTTQVKNTLHTYSGVGYSEVPYAKIGTKVYYDINYGELWVSDGITAGSLLLKNFSSDDMGIFHELNGKLLFFGDNDTDGKFELWSSDGSVAGTVSVKNVLHDYAMVPFMPYVKLGSKYFYEINQGELWVTDGTTGGSLLLKNWASDEISTFHILGNNLMLFADSDNNNSSELWKSDGTVSGTVSVKNMLQVYDFPGYSEVPYAVIGNKVFYEVNAGELWVSDGTTAGSLLLKNWVSDEISTFHELNGNLLLFADSDNNDKSELWKSDGTVAGTVQVKNMIHDYLAGPFIPYTKVGSKVFYAINFGELWVTDGTTSGSLLLKNWASDQISTFHVFNNQLMLFADSDNNMTSELWKSNGTVSGTVQVKNTLHTYGGGGYSLVPYLIGQTKVFYDINFGELWASDATTAGTILLRNYTSDDMWQFHTLNNDLLFFADDNNNGSLELWTVADVAAGLAPAVASQMQLWPVPAVDALHIHVDGDALLRGRMQVMDMRGVLVHESQVENADMELDVKDFAPGVYVLRVMGETESLVKKFVVK